METLQARVQLDERGRIVIPAAMREAMGIGEGDRVDVEVKNFEMRISTRRARIRRAQESVRGLVPPGTLVSEELIAERREEARRE